MPVTVLSRRITPALAFADATTDVVHCGTGLATSQMVSGSTLCLLYPTVLTGAERYVWSRVESGAGFNSFRQVTDGIRRPISPTYNLQVVYSAIPTYRANAWCLLGATWEMGGTVGDQRILHGDATNLVQEATSYTARTVGTPPPSNDGANPFRIGSRGGANNPFAGRIHTVLIIRDCVMALRELQELGQMMLAQVPLHNAIKGIGAAGLWYPGRNGTGTVYDESGNGNHGTVTGCSQADGPPLPRLARRAFVSFAGAAPPDGLFPPFAPTMQYVPSTLVSR